MNQTATRSGRRLSIWLRWVASAGLLAVLTACGDNPIGPSNEPEIGNNPDNFQFQASTLSGTTQTLSYSWTNTGSVADVNQSGHIERGDAVLVLRDASGAQVYSGDLKNTGTFPSSAGTAGTWRIEVRFNNVTGTVNFRVQRKS